GLAAALLGDGPVRPQRLDAAGQAGVAGRQTLPVVGRADDAAVGRAEAARVARRRQDEAVIIPSLALRAFHACGLLVRRAPEKIGSDGRDTWGKSAYPTDSDSHDGRS